MRTHIDRGKRKEAHQINAGKGEAQRRHARRRLQSESQLRDDSVEKYHDKDEWRDHAVLQSHEEEGVVDGLHALDGGHRS